MPKIPPKASFILTLCLILFSATGEASDFFIDPCSWKERRVFDSVVGNSRTPEERIKITTSKCERVVNREGEISSPNKVYTYFLSPPTAHSSRPGTINYSLEVFNERFCTNIEMDDVIKNFPPKISWVNEKLLYIEIAWSKTNGAYYILDVESGKIIRSEFMQDGHDTFKRNQAACKARI